MNKFLPSIFLTGLFIVGSIQASADPLLAHTNQKDSIPSRMLAKARITVVDLADGQPLDSVMVAAGMKKVFTNAAGEAEIDSMSKEAIIVISKKDYLLYSGRIKKELKVRLEKRPITDPSTYTNGLYQRPSEHSTAAYTSVSGDDLRKINPLNFLDALKFYAPSVVSNRTNQFGDDPNKAPATKIRGNYGFPFSASVANHDGGAGSGVQLSPSSGDFIADNVANPDQPVVLLDGIQVSLQYALDLDINRIDRVVVLKDAAATAAYGVRGGNGVIMIQTVKPRAGNFSLTFSGQVTVVSPDLRSYNMLNASDKLALEKTAGLYTNNNELYEERLDQVRKGMNTDWLSIPTQTGVGTKHYLAINGGDDDIRYGVDVSYNKMEGSMKGSGRENVNLGGYISIRMKTLRVTNYLSYTKSKASNSPFGSLNDYSKLNSYWNPYDSLTGNYTKVLDDYFEGGNRVKIYNPAYNGTLSTTNNLDYGRLADQLTIQWNLGNGFKLNGRLAFSTQADVKNLFIPPSHTLFADYSPDEFFKRGRYDQTNSQFLSIDGGLTLDYNKKLGVHQFYGSAGLNAMETSSESVGISVIGFTSDKLSDLAFGNTYATEKPEAGMIKTRLASLFGNFVYSYDNRYQIEAVVNGDASSQFGRNETFSPHWALGASWNLHQERFLAGTKFLNSFRIRGTIGTAGSLAFPAYLGRTTFNYYTDRQYIQSGSNAGTRGIGLGTYLTGYANPDLHASQTLKQNIGFDAALLQNKLFAKFDVFKSRTTDLILPEITPSSTGFLNFSYYQNIGKIDHNGVEFDLSYRVINNSKKNLVWTVMVNGLHTENKIGAVSGYVESLNNLYNDPAVDQTNTQPRYQVGQSLTAIWAVRSLGIDPATGNEKFVKKDGSETYSWSAEDKVVAGDMTPKWQGSFGTSINYKNIYAGMYFNYHVGASYYNNTLSDYIENADIRNNVDERAASNRWTRPGDGATYKALSIDGMETNPTYATTRFVEKSSLITGSSISLGYSFSQTIAAKIKSNGLRVGLIANNVFRSSDANTQLGLYYPLQKMYTFQITAGF